MGEGNTPAQAMLFAGLTAPGVGAPEHGDGGIHVKVNPDAGITLLLVANVSVLAAPAVVADQFDEVVLFLKSETLVPRIPDCTGSAPGSAVVQVPNLTSARFEVSYNLI